MENIQKQNMFSRALANEAKAGAYYTNKEHCLDIGRLLDIPEDCLILEPSIGDGTAVVAATGKRKDDHRLIYGVELNAETANVVKKNTLIEDVICTDFLNGVKITNNIFSLCFSNPPYGKDETGRRYETAFAEKIYTYMRKGGVLVYVVPEYVLEDEGFQRTLLSRYDAIGVYRFREPEYSKFKQCVFLGITRRVIGWRKEEKDQFNKMLEGMVELPKDYDGRKLSVPESTPNGLKFFTTLQFDAEHAAQYLNRSNLRKVQKELLPLEEFGAGKIGQPPVPLKKNLLYLMAVSGEGQGYVGSEDEGTAHLQRGVAKVVETSEFAPDGHGGFIETVTSSTKISLTVIEASGKVSVFE